jgi:hypothetical protein
MRGALLWGRTEGEQALLEGSQPTLASPSNIFFSLALQPPWVLAFDFLFL